MEKNIAYDAWLGNTGVPELSALYQEAFANIVMPSSPLSEVMATAVKELASGVRAMTGIDSSMTAEPLGSSYVWIGAVAESAEIGQEGYRLFSWADEAGNRRVRIAGGSDAGALYGVFHLLRLMNAGESLDGLDVVERPRHQLRMINQWDNADGSVERGYAGRSFFYEDGKIVGDVTRVRDYARLLASVGINAISVNNVNVHAVETGFVTPERLPEVARLAGAFRGYGIKLYLSVNFASPIEAGGLPTADPLDERVRDWWKRAAADVYSFIPDFGGFLVKADSEHRPGPFTYGRDHADGANLLADALSPHGGIVIWRCFVYNCMQDWRDRSTDRAKAAYEHFVPLDGRFRDNVALQIKNGPMDFQAREPVSPLFGALRKTNQLMEFQIAQEYTGQQRHLCYLVPQWKEVLDFDTLCEGEGSTVKRVADGSLFGSKLSGVAAVSNVGNDGNWTGHTLAQANLYGYGRLAWNPELSAEEIAKEWIALTFGRDPLVTDTGTRMLMDSWEIYESYTAPLGVGWMVTPHTHYGPDVDGYEYSRWGTYHFADRDGIGVDRTVATGTGYSAQYQGKNATMYEGLASCPDELLLFFHHVPYTHRLFSGKTVIQHIYDTRFEGAEQARRLKTDWDRLEGLVEESIFRHVADRLEEQAKHACHWRDVINTYFLRKSGIPDARGRTIYA